MANTKPSHLGTRKIAHGTEPEKRIPALGDGTAKPADLVYILATGKVGGSDVNAAEFFTGILDDKPEVAEDTAIVDAAPCSVIIPKSGHEYTVKLVDQNGALPVGTPLTFSTTAGAVTTNTELDANPTTIGYLAQAIVDDDTMCLIRWA